MPSNIPYPIWCDFLETTFTNKVLSVFHEFEKIGHSVKKLVTQVGILIGCLFFFPSVLCLLCFPFLKGGKNFVWFPKCHPQGEDTFFKEVLLFFWEGWWHGEVCQQEFFVAPALTLYVQDRRCVKALLYHAAASIQVLEFTPLDIWSINRHIEDFSPTTYFHARILTFCPAIFLRHNSEENAELNIVNEMKSWSDGQKFQDFFWGSFWWKWNWCMHWLLINVRQHRRNKF